MIDWYSEENHLFLNPRWPEEVRESLKLGVESWLQETGGKSFVIMPTSGTSAKDLISTKLVVHDKANFVNSAKMLGKHFGFSKQDRVLQSLPLFHVGGLSQVSRSQVWDQELIVSEDSVWNPQRFYESLEEKEISHCSLVPTQLYDLLRLSKNKAPGSLRCVFIGGGALGEQLKYEALEKAYPLRITYGMTETASMIAEEEEGKFRPFTGVEWQVDEEGLLQIRSQTLLVKYLQWQDGKVISWDPKENGFFKTEDRVQATEQGFTYLGRNQDYVKIKGEGVYLSRLQTLLQDICVSESIPFNKIYVDFVASERSGSEVHLYSVLNESEVQNVLRRFNEKALPFERIQGFHQLREIHWTDLGKLKRGVNHGN